MLSSLVSLLLLSGKRRTQNLQHADIRYSQPQGRQNTTDEVSLRLFWSIYEHSTQYFDLNMNLRISIPIQILSILTHRLSGCPVCRLRNTVYTA